MARLNRVEMLAMNNAPRRWMQRNFELPRLQRMLSRANVDLHGTRILDAGCGSGYSTQLLERQFSPRRLVGFDFMPEQIALAKERSYSCAELRVGDVTAIDERDASFDAAFVLGILHHVPGWRMGLRELARVLGAGGVLLIEDLHGRFIDFMDRFFRTAHPPEARFDWPTFRAGIEDAGLTIVQEQHLALSAIGMFLCRKDK